MKKVLLSFLITASKLIMKYLILIGKFHYILQNNYINPN